MLTLEQLYKLGLNVDIDMFEGLNLPDGNPLDRDILINTIIEKCGLNIPIYADPRVMASAITIWSARNQYTFAHVGKIFNAVYSPIENKDYYEDETIGRSRDMTDNTTGSNTRAENLSTNNSTTVTEQKVSTHSGTDTTTDEAETSAYNASDYQDNNKNTSELQHGEVISDAGNGSTTGTGSSAKQIAGNRTDNKTIDEDETTTTTRHQHGNIGITTSNKMQLEEYEMLATYNPYSFIAGLFENELTLFVY